MKNTLRLGKIALLVLCILLAACCISFADQVPNYDDYVKCDIYVNGIKIAQPATSINGNIYIDTDTLSKIGDTEKWRFDIFNLYINVEAADLNMYFHDDETTDFIKSNAGTLQFPLKRFSTPYDPTNRYYVSLGSVAEIARLSWYYRSGNVYITQYSSIHDKIALSKGNEKAFESFESGGFVNVLYKNQIFKLIKETTSFYQIEDTQGNRYYVNKDDISFIESTDEIPDYTTSGKAKDVFDRPINAMWSRLKHAPASQDGLDVLININLYAYAKDDGSCQSTLDYGFIQSAHANGYKVWICAQNGFATSAKSFINSNLANKKARDRTIAQYLFYCMVYNADGISLDYESMSYTKAGTKDNFLALVNDLCYYADKLGLTTSVATYYGNSYNNSRMYDFAFLGEHCDFILQMTYGENYMYSLSNMSKKYWTNGTNYIASLAPSEKVIMGVSYFMRYTVWDQAMNLVKSSKPKMTNIMEDIRKYNIPYVWDETVGQYYAEENYNSGGVSGTGRYYLEEERSSALKAQYIVDNHLGGTVGWEYNFTDDKAVYEAYHAIYTGKKKYADFVPLTESIGVTLPTYNAQGIVMINGIAIDIDKSEDGYQE